MNSSIDEHLKNKGKVMLRPLKLEADGSLPAAMVLLKGRECSVSFSVISLPRSFEHSSWPDPTCRDCPSESALVGFFPLFSFKCQVSLLAMYALCA